MNGLTDLIFRGVFDKFVVIDGFIVLSKLGGCVTDDDITEVLNTVTINGDPIQPYLVFKSDYQAVAIG